MSDTRAQPSFQAQGFLYLSLPLRRRGRVLSRLAVFLLLAGLALGAAASSAPPAPKARNSDGKVFVHPGIFYTQGDIDRMKAMIAAGREPWKRGFEALRFSPYANPNAWARPRGGEIDAGRFNATIGIDGRRAHDIALMWKLTGDTAYADKARDFLVQNSNWTGTSWAGTGPLDNGKIYLLVEAAELMRDYPGWRAEDQARFGRMLRDVFWPHICGGDVMRWGNQGLTAWHGALAIAIFLDDAKMYDRVWNNLVGLPHREDDAPYCSGGVWKPDWPANYGPFFIERTKPPAFGAEPDWGYDDQLRYYIYANGQCEESCRDQAHCMYGLFQMVALAEIFWNQGDDLYGQLDDRILTGLEWSLRYNMSDWEPKGHVDREEEATFANELFYRARTRNSRWTALTVSNHARGADGGPAAPKTAALMHYAVRKGVPAARMEWLTKCVKRQLANGGFESWGFGPNWYYEWEGWGTLTKMRTKWQAGDPGTWKDGARVSRAHAVPGAIRAVDYDYSPLNGTGARGTARYPGKAPKPLWPYRSDQVVPIGKVEGQPGLVALKKGERCDYTLAVAEKGRYRIVVYARNAGTLHVAARVDGGRRVSAHLPKKEKVSRMLLGTLELEAGAGVLRLEILDASAASLSAIVLEKEAGA